MIVVSDIAGNSIVYSTIFFSDWHKIRRNRQITIPLWGESKSDRTKWFVAQRTSYEENVSILHCLHDILATNILGIHIDANRSSRTWFRPRINKQDHLQLSALNCISSARLYWVWGRASKLFVSQCRSCQDWCIVPSFYKDHYCDIIMGSMASQITSLNNFYLTVYSCADQRKHQSSASLAFVWGIHRWPVNSPHKGPVTRKMFPFDAIIMRRIKI